MEIKKVSVVGIAKLPDFPFVKLHFIKFGSQQFRLIETSVKFGSNGLKKEYDFQICPHLV